MKVPMKWIRKYTPCEVSAKEFQDQMIMIGNAVEGYEEIGREVDHVVVGRVLTCQAHPDSDHLHVCQVDVGGERPLQIVCGAPNVEAGQLVAVALEGAHLPGGVKIKKGRLRGQVSEGMICSGPEMGVSPDLYPSVGEAGILVFREDYPLGADVKPILGLDETVFDFEILANRPDCLSVWGLAREAAVATGSVYHHPEIRLAPCGGRVEDYVRVEVREPELCPRYAARVVDNVRVRESPLWLRQYLWGAGMRSINNVVDITNYVMLETGHPMHAFDLDMVEGRQIIVRKAVEGEHITTLDGKEHPLTAGQLVICDAVRPSCVAGIMGGEESEITEKTHTLMFECAVFDYAATRLTARALGMRTESSGRFEKGVNPRTVMEAINRACQLIQELDAGDVVDGVIDLYPSPLQPQVVEASCERIARRAGVPMTPEEIVEILEKLRFRVERNGDALKVWVPDDRQDISGEADLCEEALRVYGYDRVPGTLLRGETTPGGMNPDMAMRRRLAGMLVPMGFLEIMNYSFVSEKSVEKLGLQEGDPRLNMLRIRNPLGEDTSVMRTTLVPSVLSTMSLNMNHGNAQVRLYEIARTFDPLHRTEEGLPREKTEMVLGIYGGQDDFFTLRGIVEMILRQLGIENHVERAEMPYLHPGRSAVLKHGDEVLCVVGEVHPRVRERFEMNDRAWIAEICVDDLMRLTQPMGTVRPLPRYPAVNRDLSLVMEESVEAGPLLRAMRDAAGPMLEEARLFDVYRNPVLGPGRKSAAFSFTFRGADHTLTEGEINACMDRILAAAADGFSAVIRK